MKAKFIFLLCIVLQSCMVDNSPYGYTSDFILVDYSEVPTLELGVYSKAHILMSVDNKLQLMVYGSSLLGLSETTYSPNGEYTMYNITLLNRTEEGLKNYRALGIFENNLSQFKINKTSRVYATVQKAFGLMGGSTYHIDDYIELHF